MCDTLQVLITTAMWKYYAIQSALFAALNAIFAKVGVCAIDSDLATAIRTAIILLINLGHSPHRPPYWPDPLDKWRDVDILG